MLNAYFLMLTSLKSVLIFEAFFGQETQITPDLWILSLNSFSKGNNFSCDLANK